MKDYYGNKIDNLTGDDEQAENTYQITGNELITICEAISDGYSLESVESDDKIMSIILSKRNCETMTFNFLR